MNKLLLQKTEEQALYIIQLNSKIEKQQKEHEKESVEQKVQIQQLNARIQALEAQQQQNKKN